MPCLPKPWISLGLYEFCHGWRACQERPAVSLMPPPLRAGPGASLNLPPEPPPPNAPSPPLRHRVLTAPTTLRRKKNQTSLTKKTQAKQTTTTTPLGANGAGEQASHRGGERRGSRPPPPFSIPGGHRSACPIPDGSTAPGPPQTQEG